MKMGVKFAGSRSIDERRRRRLAGENDVSSPPALSPSAPSAGFWSHQRTKEESENTPLSPLASLIPPSRFRIWAFCAAVPLIGLLLVLCSQSEYLLSDQRLQTSFGLQQGHLWRFVRGILFLGVAGLCWLVSWFRSANDRDFEGCYKSWYFSGWIFLVFGFVAGSDAHLVFAQMVGDYTQLQQPFLRTLIWVVPMAALLLEPMRCFTREMWHCKRSCLMMTLCCLASLVYLEMKAPVSGQSEIFTASSSHLIAIAASILAPTLLFSAILSQVYYVMYVSSASVPRRQSWTWIAMMWVNDKMFAGLKSTGSYCFSAIKNVSSSTKSRLTKRSDQSKKSRSTRRADRKAERKTARQKAADEKALKKQNAIAEKRAMAEAKAIAKEEAKAKKAEAFKAKELERTSTAEVKAKAEAASKLEKQTQRSKRAERKQSRKTQPVGQTPFKQIAADRHEKKEPVRTAKVSAETESQRNAGKPRIRLKSQEVSDSSDSYHQESSQQEPELSVRHSRGKQKASKSQENAEQSERIDPSNLKGLSKKERRRIRKLHREQQREDTRKAG